MNNIIKPNKKKEKKKILCWQNISRRISLKCSVNMCWQSMAKNAMHNFKRKFYTCRWYHLLHRGYWGEGRDLWAAAGECGVPGCGRGGGWAGQVAHAGQHVHAPLLPHLRGHGRPDLCGGRGWWEGLAVFGRGEENLLVIIVNKLTKKLWSTISPGWGVNRRGVIL